MVPPMRASRRFAALLLLLPAMAAASGPRWVTGPPFFTGPQGIPVGWKQPTLLYYTDPGALSSAVDHQAADAIVAAAASVWNVPVASVTIGPGGALAEHVSGQNTYLDTSGLVFPDDVLSTNASKIPIAVIYDSDGSVTDLLLGSGASDPGGCRQNAVTQTVDSFDPAGYILHAIIVLNGRCTGRAPELQLEMQYQLMRAFGRVLGLAWSQTNDNVFTGSPTPTHAQATFWPIMHPLDILCGPYAYQCLPSPFQLRPDDIGSLVAVYPNAQNVPALPGKQPSLDNGGNAVGHVYFPTGEGMAGVNLLVRREADGGTTFDAFYVASGVTGASFHSRGRSPFVPPDTSVSGSFGSTDPNSSGAYSIAYVPILPGNPWENLSITTEPINLLYAGEHGLGPYALNEVSFSGSTVSQVSYVNGPWSEDIADFTIADAAPTCNTGADGTALAPIATPPSGWWKGLVCGFGHAACNVMQVKPGRSITVEVTALDAQGLATEAKAMPVIGIFAPTDSPTSLPTLGVTPAAFNSIAVGMTTLSAQTGPLTSLRFGIADERGDGRPDFSYQARVFYADTVLPQQIAPTGGSITISGSGFRPGNAVFINGVAAKTLSWTPTTIVATAPSMALAQATNGTPVDVLVRDLSTGAGSTMTAAFSYTTASILPNTLHIVTAPVPPIYVGDTAATSFAVQVLAADGVTPVVGDPIVFTATSGTAQFSVCVATTCIVRTDANGLASTGVTPESSGVVTVQAADGPLSQAASFAATAQTGSLNIWSAPRGNVPVGVVAENQIALDDLMPNKWQRNPGRSVTFSVLTGAATFSGCATSTCVVITDGAGTAKISVTPTALGPVTIQAADGDVTATVSFIAVSNTDVMTVATSPTPTVYLGDQSGTFAVNLFQVDGVTRDYNQFVTFTGPAGVVFYPCASNVCTVTTGWGGIASVSVKASQTGVFSVQATFAGVSQNATFAVVPHTIQLNILTVPNGTVVTGSFAATPFSAQLLQDGMTPISGVDVSLGGAPGSVALGACAGGAPQCRWLTDGNGIISTTVMPLRPGLITLSAVYAPVVTSATFTAVGVGRTMTVLTQPPATVWVGDTVNFDVRLLSPGGISPMSGDPVLYSIVGPFGFSDWSATDVTRQADGNGEAFEFGRAWAAGAVTVTASDGVVSQTFQFTAIARPDVVNLVSAPASGGVSGAVASSPLTAQILLQDAVTPAASRTVTISVTNGAASFAACAGAATCQLVTNANGMVTTLVTPLSSGSITLSVSEGGVSQTVSFTVTSPVVPPQLSVTALNPATYIAAGATVSFPLNVVAIYNGSPAGAQGVQWLTSSGFATATTSTVTNSGGNSSELIFLGPIAAGGDAIATACAWGNICARFDGFGVASANQAMAVVRGTQQSVVGGAPLAPVVAMVVDAAGHPVAAAPVSVYQTVTSFDAACPDRGRCPAAVVLATQATVEVSGIDGIVSVTPLVVNGKATQTEIAFSVGTQGFATVVETAQP